MGQESISLLGDIEIKRNQANGLLPAIEGVGVSFCLNDANGPSIDKHHADAL